MIHKGCLYVAQTSIQCQWLPYECADGQSLMATDASLLEELRQPDTPPTLIGRLYRWSEPTLSLGKHQRESDIPALQQESPEATAIVRRPTGGRALLHGQDVSFAFVTNANSMTRLKLKDSYCLFTKWIKAALADIGVPLVHCDDATDSGYIVNASCLATQTPYDLKTLDGSKVVASSQLRRQGGILQHGAIFIDWGSYSLEAFEVVLREKATDSLKEFGNINW